MVANKPQSFTLSNVGSDGETPNITFEGLEILITEDEAKIDKNIQDIEDLSANITEIGTTLEALDAELEEEKQTRADADNAINERITSLHETVDNISGIVTTVDGQTIVGGSYDKDNGTLTLNRKNDENNITVQFNFNFGTF